MEFIIHCPVLRLYFLPHSYETGICGHTYELEKRLKTWMEFTMQVALGSRE